MSWVATDDKWWCSKCLAHREGDAPDNAPRATVAPNEKTEHTYNFYKLCAWLAVGGVLVIGGALMIEQGYEKAGWVMVGAAVLPVLVLVLDA
jgi:hypothetical protein